MGIHFWKLSIVNRKAVILFLKCNILKLKLLEQKFHPYRVEICILDFV